MHFTVVFTGEEGRDASFGLVFTPVPVWMANSRELVNLHPDNPHYRRGDLQPLHRSDDFPAQIRDTPGAVVVVVHPLGYGRFEDLLTLRSELYDAGYSATVVMLADAVRA